MNNDIIGRILAKGVMAMSDIKEIEFNKWVNQLENTSPYYIHYLILLYLILQMLHAKELIRGYLVEKIKAKKPNRTRINKRDTSTVIQFSTISGLLHLTPCQAIDLPLQCGSTHS